MIPTGGINSPFIWYTLNPILMAANFLPIYYPWLIISFYFIISGSITAFIFNNNYRIYNIVSQELDILLIFVLMTLAVQLVSNLAKKYKKQKDHIELVNEQLKETNKKYQKSIDNMMSLHQTLEMVLSNNNKKNIINYLVEFAKDTTESDFVFFCWNDKFRKEYIISSSKENQFCLQDIKKQHKYIENNFLNQKKDILLKNKNKYIIYPVKSTSKYHGYIGIKLNNNDIKSNFLQYKHIKFIADLSSIILDNIDFNNVNEHLMILEEQNRIGNEMHDNVAQRLFSISCGIHSIIKKMEEMSEEMLKDQLMLIDNSSRNAMKELRDTIYKLSLRKNENKDFINRIKEYIDDISQLNNVKVKLDIKGDDNILSNSLKIALYRIVLEASGNAIRHGKCKRLYINIILSYENIKVVIKDDGVGFEYNKDTKNRKKGKGIGLENMRNLAKSFNGNVSIDSKKQEGTTIIITIPYITKLKTEY